MTQKQSVIALQETQDFSENNEKKRDERDIKEIDQSDFSRNHKCIDDAMKFNNVASQAWKWRHCTLCDELESLSSFRKVSDMNEENCKLSACSV